MLVVKICSEQRQKYVEKNKEKKKKKSAIDVHLCCYLCISISIIERGDCSCLLF